MAILERRPNVDLTAVLGLRSRILGLCLAVGLGLGASCFSPDEPECAFSCVADGVCPTAYHCAGDGLCHRDDGQGVCTLPPQVDAGADTGDASSSDGRDDDAPTEAGNDAP
jgi:hypothetical protein